MNRTATLVLDSEGLARWISKERSTTALIEAARRDDVSVVVSANTILEVTHARVDRARLRWLQSQMKVQPVTQDRANAGADLLVKAGLHGHKHAIDATVVQTALEEIPPVAVLTSDPGDIEKLADGRVEAIPL